MSLPPEVFTETAAASCSSLSEKEMSLSFPFAVGSVLLIFTGAAMSGSRSSVTKVSISSWLILGAGSVVGAVNSRSCGQPSTMSSVSSSRSTVSPAFAAVFLTVVPSRLTLPSTGLRSESAVASSTAAATSFSSTVTSMSRSIPPAAWW